MYIKLVWRSIGFRILVEIPSSNPVHFWAPYAPFSKPKKFTLNKGSISSRDLRRFWVILTQDPAKISPSKSCPNQQSTSSCHSQRSCRKSSNLELPCDHTGDALAGFRCCCFFVAKESRCHPWACKTKNIMNLHYSKSIVIS